MHELIKRYHLLDITTIGLVLVIVGFVLAFVALILTISRKGGQGETKSAGILLIGPIPIIFGSDRDSVKVLVVLAVVLIAVFLVFMVVPSLLLNR